MSQQSGKMLAQKASKLHSAGKFAQAEKIYKRLLKANPNDLTLIRVLGMLERDRKNLSAALNWFELAKQLSGNHPTFLAEIALTKLNQGKLAEAYALSAEANKANPKDLDVATFYAKVCLAYGQGSKAMHVLEDAIESNPTHHDAMRLLASSAVQSGIIPVPLERIQQFIRMRPNDAAAHTTLGIAQRLNGNHELAIESLDRALVIDPVNQEALASKAEVLISLRRPKEALELLKSTDHQNSAVVTLALARGHRVQGDYQNAIEFIKRLDTKKLSPKHHQSILKEYGRLLDQIGSYEEAWERWTEANALRANSYDVTKHQKQVQSIIDTPCKKYEQSSSSKPIFIVGMYRSGTTLLEQILSSHSKIDAKGEVDLFLRFVHEINYPDCCTEPNSDWSSRYLERTESSATFTTDKMPMNYLHIGLIKSVFPNATVIHITRNPLDTFVSCFSNSFASTHGYTQDIHEFRLVYKEYQRIMSHWHNLFDDIFEVPYESLATNLEPTLRNLFEVLDIPFEDECIRFFESERIAQTPSIDQVRKPIYSSSVGRWENYEKFLSDLTDLQ